MRKIGVLVSGRGSNLQAIIQEIQAGRLPLAIAIVISDVPGALALERARQAGLPTLALDRKAYRERAAFEQDLDAALRQAGCELVVLAGFMRLLSPAFVAAWPHLIINIHPALLPSFPGLHGQAQAVAYGVKYSGCTVHFVDAGTDSGPIILQRVVPVLDDDTEDSLAQRILVQEHQALPEALRLWAQGQLVLEGRRVKLRAAKE